MESNDRLKSAEDDMMLEYEALTNNLDDKLNMLSELTVLFFFLCDLSFSFFPPCFSAHCPSFYCDLTGQQAPRRTHG